jgi:hypothetical protein
VRRLFEGGSKNYDQWEEDQIRNFLKEANKQKIELPKEYDK